MIPSGERPGPLADVSVVLGQRLLGFFDYLQGSTACAAGEAAGSASVATYRLSGGSGADSYDSRQHSLLASQRAKAIGTPIILTLILR